MKNMFRRLRNLLLLLPVLLLFWVLYASARSYLPDHLFFRSHQGKLVLAFVSGSQVHWFDRSDQGYLATADIIWTVRRYSTVRKAPEGKLGGIEWVGIDFKSDRPCMLLIPYWYLITPLAIASVWSVLILRRRRMRQRPGHCAECGYDLRASTEKCPECGAANAQIAARN